MGENNTLTALKGCGVKKQITEQGTKMKYVHYNTLRLELRSTGESAEQPPKDLNGITPNHPGPSL